MNFLKKIAIIFVFVWPAMVMGSSKIRKQAFLKNYTVNQGVGSNTVYQSIVDKNGLIWFATNRGISIYNGREFTSFTTLNGLEGNTVFGFHKDFKGRIWYYTMEGRIGYYDNQGWHSVSANDQLVKKYGGKVIGSLYVNEDGSVLLGFKEKVPGIVKIFPDGTIKELSLGKEQQLLYKPYPDKDVWTQGSGESYAVWIDSTRIPINRNEPTEDILYLESGDKRFLTYNQTLFSLNDDNQIQKEFGFLKRIYSVFYDAEDGTYYIGFRSGGVCLMRKNQQTYHFLKNTTVYHINKDEEGGIWFCTEKKGIFYWHPSQPFYYKRSTPFNIGENELIVSYTGKSFIVNDNNCLLEYLLTKNKIEVDTVACEDYLENYSVVDSFLIFHNSNTTSILNTNNFKVLNELKNHTFYDLKATDSLIYLTSLGVKSIHKKTFESTDIVKKNERFFAIAEDKGKLYLSKGDGLYVYHGKLKKVNSNIPELNRKAVALYTFNNGLLINLSGVGLVWWNKSERNAEIIRRITLGSFVKRVHFLSDSAFTVLSEVGLELVELKGQKYTATMLSDDLVDEKVKDVYVINDSVYFFYDKGIFITRLSDLKRSVINKLPDFGIKKIIVNDTLVKNKLDRLSSGQNNVSVQLKLTSYAYLKNIELQYKLNERSWKEVNNYNIELNDLLPGKYELNVKMLYKQTVVKEKQLMSFEVYPPLYKRTWFIVLTCILMLSLSFWLGKYLTDQKQDVLQEKLLKQKAQLNAVQAQINPHFLFNVFNSIQHLVLKEQTKEALQSMSRFSKLMRMALNHSKYEFISLSEELKFLKLYISLENLRLEKKVEFEIMLGDDIDPELITIPPLIIQILIENSMWHGLQPSDKNRLLIIKIIKVGGLLNVLIIDNGIGVKKSKELKSKFGRQPRSMGMSLIQEKIEILEKLYGVEGMGIQYSITNPAASNEGTTVNLKIMYGENF